MAVYCRCKTISTHHSVTLWSKKDLLQYLVEGTYLVHEVRQITYSLKSYAVENPRSEDGPVYAKLGPSITTDAEIKKSVMATRKQNHLFAYFCLQGTLHVYACYDLLLLLLQCMGGQNNVAYVSIYNTNFEEERE